MYLTYRRTLAVLGTAAAVAGLGGTAVALTGSDVTAGRPSATPSDQSKHDKHHKRDVLRALKRLDHAQVVTTGKDGKTVTRTLWVGGVTAVSTKSVTVKARDGKAQTYAVTSDTKIAQKVKGKKPADSSIAKIAKGDRVFVAGTGTGTVTAQRVLELPAR